MPLKPQDFEGGQFRNVYEIGAEQIVVDEFKFNKNNLAKNPMLAIMAIIAIDPTEKQRELMEKIDIVFVDDNGKQVFPKVEPKKCNHKSLADGEPCIYCGKTSAELWDEEKNVNS